VSAPAPRARKIPRSLRHRGIAASGCRAVRRAASACPAATYNLKGERKPTKRYQAFLDHFRLKYTRINAGKSNENVVVEKGHDVFKTAVNQALILRGSRDFVTLEEYLAFVEQVRRCLNLKVASRLTALMVSGN